MTTFTSSIHGCARCHSDGHEDVVWQPLTHPIVDSDGTWTHWAPCPINGEPILMQTRAVATDPLAPKTYVVVTNSRQMANDWARFRKLAGHQVVVLDTHHMPHSAHGLSPKTHEVVWLDGWKHGRYAHSTELALAMAGFDLPAGLPVATDKPWELEAWERRGLDESAAADAAALRDLAQEFVDSHRRAVVHGGDDADAPAGIVEREEAVYLAEILDGVDEREEPLYDDESGA